MHTSAIKYNSILTGYFVNKPLYLDLFSRQQPNIRKLVEQPWQQTKAQLWDEVIETLCNLCFIEAKCIAGMTFVLIGDYHQALDNIPERQEEVAEEKQRKERIGLWKREIIKYSHDWSIRRKCLERGEIVTESEPVLPVIIPSSKPWTEERIQAECQRMIENPTRLDRLFVFSQFVEAECYYLLEFAVLNGFVVQHAFNIASIGPVHQAADKLRKTIIVPMLLCRWTHNSSCNYNPRPVLRRTFEGHTKSVNSVSVTPDSLRAVTGSSDKTLRVWNLESGQCLRVIRGHSEGVIGVSITPDGRYAVSWSNDNTVRYWDLENGACLYMLTKTVCFDQSVSISPDGQCVVLGCNNSLWVWNPEIRGLRCIDRRGENRCVSVTPDGRQAVSWGGPARIIGRYKPRVWDLDTGQCLRTLERVQKCTSITPDGRRAITGSTDNTLRVWDLVSGTCLRMIKGHRGWINSVSMTTDGRHAISVSEDNTLRVWDLESGACLRTLEVGYGSVESVSILPDGRRAISCGMDNTLRIWDIESGRNWDISGKDDKCLDVVITPDGHWAISSHSNKTLRVWDPKSGTCLHTLAGHDDLVICLVITTDGNHLISGSIDKTLRIWSLESGDCKWILRGHNDLIKCVSVTQDGHYAVSGSDDRTLRLWDLKQGICLRILKCHIKGINRVFVTSDGKRAVSKHIDHELETIKIWDLENGACLSTFKGTDLCVTPDGKQAVSSSPLRVWDMESGACLHILEGDNISTGGVSITPEGRRALSWSNKWLRVWDLKSGACLHVLKGHNNDVNSVSFTPDGRLALSADKHEYLANNENMIRVWDLDTGMCLFKLAGHTGHINSVGVTPDGQRAVSESSDKTIRIWDLENGQCIALARFISAGISQNGAIFERELDGSLRFIHAHGITPGPDLKPDISQIGYELLLRRDLEFSRREKGEMHEETVAHITALKTHLEQMCQPEATHQLYFIQRKITQFVKELLPLTVANFLIWNALVIILLSGDVGKAAIRAFWEIHGFWMTVWLAVGIPIFWAGCVTFTVILTEVEYVSLRLSGLKEQLLGICLFVLLAGLGIYEAREFGIAWSIAWKCGLLAMFAQILSIVMAFFCFRWRKR